MLSEGFTYSVVSKRLGCSISTVVRVGRSLGIKMRKGPRPGPRTRFTEIYEGIRYSSRVSSHKLECSIDEDFLSGLWKMRQGRCAYSGLPMTLEKHKPNTVSVDRRDSTKGYTKRNTTLCCVIVNRMKTDLSLQDFREWCRAITEYHAPARELFSP